MQWIKEKKYFIVIFAALILFAIYSLHSKQQESEFSLQVMESEALSSDSELDDTQDVSEENNLKVMKVDVKGAVKHPGVYSVTEDERVIDVIAKAGGLLENGDESKINLSQKVADEMVIYVPYVGEEGTGIFAQESTSNQSATDKVNINQADSADLQTLPGIGPGKADAIIEYRDQNGPFKTIEDLMNVSGIGEKTFEKLKEHIAVQ